MPIEKITKILSMLGKQWLLKITGGEPFLHPNFVELCQTVIRTNEITVDTNLSIDMKIKDFAENIDPDKVRDVHAALNIDEREKKDEVEAFIENVLLLKKIIFVYLLIMFFYLL